MCTLTLLDRGVRGHRLAFNRDERRDRVEGEPSRIEVVDGVTIVAPRDPEGGGSWIAANDHGITAVILNGNPPSERRAFDAGGASRGGLVLAAAAAPDLDAAARAIRVAAAGVRRPFRFFATDGRRILRAGVRLDPARTPFELTLEAWDGHPVMAASSGIGDHLVEPVRRARFESMLDDHGSGEDPAAMQDAFHASVAPLRPHLAVRTSRPEARTVATSVVEVNRSAGAVRFTHRDLPAEEGTPDRVEVRTLPLVRGVVG